MGLVLSLHQCRAVEAGHAGATRLLPGTAHLPPRLNPLEPCPPRPSSHQAYMLSNCRKSCDACEGGKKAAGRKEAF